MRWAIDLKNESEDLLWARLSGGKKLDTNAHYFTEITCTTDR